MSRSVSAAFVLTALLLLPFASARADSSKPELLNFIYLQNLQSVGNFYDGGGGPGVPNYGVTFSNFWGLRSGGGGNFSPDPLNTPIVFINSTYNGASGNQVTGTMNVAPGFSNGLNFFYTAAFQSNQSETVTIWSGTNGTGTVLATLKLSSNDTSCVPASFCTWTDVGVKFSGTAYSVTFSGPSDQIGIGDITINSPMTALPEPSSFYLLGMGLVGVYAGRIRRLFGI